MLILISEVDKWIAEKHQFGILIGLKVYRWSIYYYTTSTSPQILQDSNFVNHHHKISNHYYYSPTLNIPNRRWYKIFRMHCTIPRPAWNTDSLWFNVPLDVSNSRWIVCCTKPIQHTVLMVYHRLYLVLLNYDRALRTKLFTPFRCIWQLSTRPNFCKSIYSEETLDFVSLSVLNLIGLLEVKVSTCVPISALRTLSSDRQFIRGARFDEVVNERYQGLINVTWSLKCTARWGSSLLVVQNMMFGKRNQTGRLPATTQCCWRLTGVPKMVLIDSRD